MHPPLRSIPWANIHLAHSLLPSVAHARTAGFAAAAEDDDDDGRGPGDRQADSLHCIARFGTDVWSHYAHCVTSYVSGVTRADFVLNMSPILHYFDDTVICLENSVCSVS